MFRFKSNMSTVDRATRIVVGSTLLTLGPLTGILPTDSMSNIILGVLGAIAITSGVFAYCFLYEITGFNTLHKPDNTETNQ